MDNLLDLVRCPRTGQTLKMAGGRLVTEDGSTSYPVEDGIPVLLPEAAEEVRS
jgi:uncharacterized protein YbaR (Trm112 family)